MLKGKFLTFIFEKSSRVDTKIQIPDTGTGTSPVLCPARPDFRSPQRIRKFRIMGYLLDLDSGGAQNAHPEPE